MQAQSTPPTRPAAPRHFGRFELRRLLGKSERSMTWLGFDPRMGQEVMLQMPRVQPAGAAALELWQRDARRVARLNHPNLAHVVETGAHEQWPYLAFDRANGLTLVEWLAERSPPTPLEVVELFCQALQGIAFAHEAGLPHRDLQLHALVVSEQGQVRVIGLGAAGPSVGDDSLRAQRDDASRDLLALGVLLHRVLSAQDVLDESDTGRVMARMVPFGREFVRLPWTTPHPIPEALRAIANRATAGQERQRYHNARTLLRALNGWREAQAAASGGPLTLLLDRLRTVGHLPAMPGVGGRVAKLAGGESQRNDEMAEQILADMALCIELLRTVNSAVVTGTQVTGAGPVVTIRRTIALLGMNGIRQAANALRPWPGPLSEPHAAALKRVMERVRLAGLAAQALRPAGYDAEVTYLVTVFQNLGRLLVRYHFPDEAEQIHQLMQPAPPPDGSPPGTAEQPGMAEEAAAFAVLGVDIEALGTAVAQHWGFGDEVQHMIRRLPTSKPPRTPDGDADILRSTASAANEAVDAISTLPAKKVGPALVNIANRYARILELSPKDFQEALQGARAALQSGAPVAPVSREADEPKAQKG